MRARSWFDDTLKADDNIWYFVLRTIGYMVRNLILSEANFILNVNKILIRPYAKFTQARY